jgi:hypothetical protein
MESIYPAPPAFYKHFTQENVDKHAARELDASIAVFMEPPEIPERIECFGVDWSVGGFGCY